MVGKTVAAPGSPGRQAGPTPALGVHLLPKPALETTLACIFDPALEAMTSREDYSCGSVDAMSLSPSSAPLVPSPWIEMMGCSRASSAINFLCG